MAREFGCALFASLLATASLCAQDDLRDRVVLKNGRSQTGRVVTPFATDEVLLVQGGKRIRIERADVARMELVAHRVREFFERRNRHRQSRRALRYLVDWANGRQLPGLARLQALELVLQGDDDEQLHTLLGHRRRGNQWQWPHDGKWLTREKLTAAMLDDPMLLTGERFRLRCDAGLLTNVRALFDLERLAVEWFDRFGAPLLLNEVLQPIDVRTYRNVDQFPKWGFRPRAYYEPPPHGDRARTFYAGPTPKRPELLFFVGTQGLLYHTMIGEVDRQNSRDRVCAWLEVGLGMHMQHVMQGAAGFAVPARAKKQDLQALRAMSRSYRLTHLVHLPMYGSFYLTDDTATASNWSAAAMFVTWLLEKDNQPKTRDAFLAYVRAALVDRQGDSSSTFDRVMGRPIEQFEEPWREWLSKLAGF